MKPNRTIDFPVEMIGSLETCRLVNVRRVEKLTAQLDEMKSSIEFCRVQIERLNRIIPPLRDQRFVVYLRTPCWRYRV